LQATYRDRPIADFLAGLHGDLLWERSQMEILMKGLEVSAGAPRRWVAWLSEKFSELRMALDDRSGGDFRLFETLEALSVGIAGKRLLWKTLATIARETPLPVQLDYRRL